MTKCSQKNRQTTDNNVVKICQEQHRQNHLVHKALKRGHNFSRLEISSYFPSLMVCIVGHYVIRHKARGECQERWELFPYPVSRDRNIRSRYQGILHVRPPFLVHCPHSYKSNAYWLHCPQTGNPLMSPGLAALKNISLPTICICKGKINISV